MYNVIMIKFGLDARLIYILILYSDVFYLFNGYKKNIDKRFDVGLKIILSKKEMYEI